MWAQGKSVIDLSGSWLILGLTVGTLITSAIVTGAAAPSAHAKPLFKSDHSWEDILGESFFVSCHVLGMGL